MRMDKLTSRFQSALADAQSLAVGRDNQFIEPAHLLLALIDAEGGGTRPLLQLQATDDSPRQLRRYAATFGKSLSELALLSDRELLRIPSFGRKSLKLLRQWQNATPAAYFWLGAEADGELVERTPNEERARGCAGADVLLEARARALYEDFNVAPPWEELSLIGKFRLIDAVRNYDLVVAQQSRIKRR